MPRPTSMAAPTDWRPARRAKESPGGRPKPKTTLSLGLIAVGLVFLGSIYGALDASRLSGLSQDARVPGRVQQAIDLAARATRADPMRPEYWHGLGLSYAAASRWRDAAAAFDRAGRLAPHEIRYKGDEIAALVSVGDSDARARAAQLADISVSMDPNNPLAQLSRANVMQLSGNFPEALRSVERALALDPGSMNDRLYITAAQVYLDSGRPTDALAAARKGLAIIDAREVSVRSVPLRYELARALATNGQRKDALEELDLILRIRPGYAPAQLLKAQLGAVPGS
jgi:tetratricopeptide (TPR) repeat protein